MTLDEFLTRRAELNEAKRATEWALADQAALFVREFGKESLGKVAEVDRSTKGKVANQARLSAAFPNEVRYPDVPVNFYQTVLKASKRVKESPTALLKKALEENMSNKDLNKLGKKPKDVAKLNATCEWCGAKVKVEHPEQGTKILCPVCKEQGRESTLGLLE